MPSRTILVDPNTSEQGIVKEGTSCIIEVQFVDRSGNNVALEAIDTLTATLTNAVDGTVINSRDGQNILNTNQGTVSDTGLLTLKLGPLDNIIVSTSTERGESHYLTIDWAYIDSDGASMVGQENFQYICWPDQLDQGMSESQWLTA